MSGEKLRTMRKENRIRKEEREIENNCTKQDETWSKGHEKKRKEK